MAEFMKILISSQPEELAQQGIVHLNPVLFFSHWDMFRCKPLSRMNTFNQHKFTSALWGLKKALMGNVWNGTLQLQVDDVGWGWNGNSAQTILQHLIMKHLQGPTDDRYCILQWESAWVDFFFTGQSVGMLSNTITCSVFGTIIHTYWGHSFYVW